MTKFFTMRIDAFNGKTVFYSRLVSLHHFDKCHVYDLQLSVRIGKGEDEKAKPIKAAQ